jgi:choline dehydrogenase-like flavoprotein
LTTGDTPRFANLADVLAPRYDVIVCGAGSSGSVIACRLAENPDVRVLLLEAGGSDEVTSVSEASQWPLNLGGELDWNFYSEPDPSLNGRSIPFSMGKVLGGGSSINLMIWARGHRSDWDHFATESGEPTWGYEPVLDLYRSLEDWRGTGEADYRGAGGPIFVQPAPNAHPLAVAAVDAARTVGIPTYQSPNGRMMEEKRGAEVFRSPDRNPEMHHWPPRSQSSARMRWPGRTSPTTRRQSGGATTLA